MKQRIREKKTYNTLMGQVFETFLAILDDYFHQL